MKTDADLIAAWIERRDETAFAGLVTRHEQLVYRVCLRVVQAPDQAEDASQATFVVLLKKAQSVRHIADLSSWLYKTARNVALHTLRTNARRSKREREATMVAQESPQGEAYEIGEKAQAVLDEALASLSRGQREAVVLRHLKGYSSTQAASVLGCTEMALRSRLSKGLAKLRKRLSRRGVALAAGGLLALLDAEAHAAVPQTLLPSVLAVSKSLAAGAAGGSSAVVLAEGAMKMMMWMKMKSVGGLALCTAGLLALVAAVPGMGNTEDHSTRPPFSTNKTGVPGSQAAKPGRKTIVSEADRLLVATDLTKRFGLAPEATPLGLFAGGGHVYILVDNLQAQVTADKEPQRETVLIASPDRGRTWRKPASVRGLRSVAAAFVASDGLHLVGAMSIDGAAKGSESYGYMLLSAEGAILARHVIERPYDHRTADGKPLNSFSYSSHKHVLHARGKTLRFLHISSGYEAGKERVRLRLLESTDNGRTWGKPVFATSMADWGWWSPTQQLQDMFWDATCQDQRVFLSEDLLGLAFTSAFLPAEVERHEGVVIDSRRHSDTIGLVTSQDRGRSWKISKVHIDIADRGSHPYMLYPLAAYAQGQRLWILLTASEVDLDAIRKEERLADLGRELPREEEAELEELEESVQQPRRGLYITCSDDGGRTWRAAMRVLRGDLGIEVTPGDGYEVLHLSDPVLLCTNNRIVVTGTAWRQPLLDIGRPSLSPRLRIAWSEDQGLSWQEQAFLDETSVANYAQVALDASIGDIHCVAVKYVGISNQKKQGRRLTNPNAAAPTGQSMAGPPPPRTESRMLFRSILARRSPAAK